MAKTDFIPTTTAACDLGRCGSCRGVVLSLTDAHLTDCQHGCHQPDPVQEEELDDLLDREADRRLDQVLVDELFGAEL
jgi:hypothetical protein